MRQQLFKFRYFTKLRSVVGYANEISFNFKQ
jgi:hypothetical protein